MVTEVKVPAELQERVEEAARLFGYSEEEFILQAIEQALPSRPAGVSKRKRLLHLDPPTVPGEGRKPFDLTNEQIYDLIDFP